MKKVILVFLTLLTLSIQSQTVPQNNRMAITKNIKQNNATRIIVQDSITKELNWVLKSSIASPIPTIDQVLGAGSSTIKSITLENLTGNFLYSKAVQFVGQPATISATGGGTSYLKFASTGLISDLSYTFNLPSFTNPNNYFIAGSVLNNEMFRIRTDGRMIISDGLNANEAITKGQLDTAVSAISNINPALQQVLTQGNTTTIPITIAPNASNGNYGLNVDAPTFDYGINSYSNNIGINTTGGIYGINTQGDYAGINSYSDNIGIITNGGDVGLQANGDNTGISSYGNTVGISSYSDNIGIATNGGDVGLQASGYTTGISASASVVAIEASSSNVGINITSGLTGINVDAVDVGIVATSAGVGANIQGASVGMNVFSGDYGLIVISSGTGIKIISGSNESAVFVIDNSNTSDIVKFNKDTTTQASISHDGKVSANGFITNGTVRLKNYTVATLPVGVQGDTAYVTNALVPTYMTTVVGGGSVVTPVFYNGVNWVCH